MKKILFVCHGNICRSPMAEYVMKYLVAKKHMQDEISIASAATSREEIGNDIHAGTKRMLDKNNIPYTAHCARQLERRDFDLYDYLIGMDRRNIQNMKRMSNKDIDHKLFALLDFTQPSRDIADPWYSGDFETTYQDINEGCHALLTYIIEHDSI